LEILEWAIVVLIVVEIVVALWPCVISHGGREVGRFIQSDAGSFILTDTKTGQWCLAVNKKSPESDMPFCRDLR